MTSGGPDLPEERVFEIVSPGAAELYVDVVFDRAAPDRAASAAAEELVEHRLAGVEHDSGALFAYPPRTALARASTSRVRAWLALAERAVDSIEQLASVLGDGSIEDSAEVDATGDRERTLGSIIMSATQDICLAQDWHDDPEFMEPGRSAVAPEAVDAPELPHRYVYDHRLFGAPWFVDAVEQEVAAGIEVRATQVAIPSFLLVVDAKIAAYTPSADQPGRVTSDDGLVGLLTLAVEQLSSRAVPVDASQEMTSAQRSVLALVGLGYTNRMISRAWDLHERIVRRRVDVGARQLRRDRARRPGRPIPPARPLRRPSRRRGGSRVRPPPTGVISRRSGSLLDRDLLGRRLLLARSLLDLLAGLRLE